MKSTTKKIESVTRLPGWMLRKKGKKDSQRGKGVCDEYIRRLHKKLVSMESKAAIDVENTLYDVRKEAAVLVMEIAELKKSLSETPEEKRETCISCIRMERKIKYALARLIELNEFIVNVNSAFEMYIAQLQASAEEKICFYITGVRSGNLTDYEYGGEENTIKETCRMHHTKLDDQIGKLVWSKIEEAQYEVV